MPDLNKIQTNVLAICRMYPEAIDNPTILLEKYWLTFCGWDQTKSLYYNLSKATRPETITRRFREIREMGLIEQSSQRDKEVLEAMQNEQMRVKDNFKPAAVSWLND